MKKILAVSLMMSICACRPASVIPDAGTTPEGAGDVSIAYLKTLYNGAPVRITGELRISGCVVSSDRKGNFYKTIVIEDDTGGIELKANLEEIFKHYPIHSRLDVNCNGLWIGSYGGTLQLGDEPSDGWQTQYIHENDLPLHLQPRGPSESEVRPRRITISQIAPELVSTFVCFEDVRFIDEERGFTWADADSDEDTERHLTDAAGDTLTLRTSRYATFAGKTLPFGSGYIEGVLGYFNGRYRLTVIDDQAWEIP